LLNLLRLIISKNYLKMKKTLFASILMFSCFLFQSATAQVHMNLRVNIASQPAWGPVGYDYVDYYYLPDIDAYYYVPKSQYIYQEQGHWLFSAQLPARYNNYDIYNGYKVVVNRPTPYRYAQTYRTRYSGYKNRHDQGIIRNSQDSRYYQVKGHPQNNKWQKTQIRKGRGHN